MKKTWFFSDPSRAINSGLLDPDFDFMFGARERIDLSFQEEPYRGPYNSATINGQLVRGTQVNDSPPIGKVMVRRGAHQ